MIAGQMLAGRALASLADGLRPDPAAIRAPNISGGHDRRALTRPQRP